MTSSLTLRDTLKGVPEHIEMEPSRSTSTASSSSPRKKKKQPSSSSGCSPSIVNKGVHGGGGGNSNSSHNSKSKKGSNGCSSNGKNDKPLKRDHLAFADYDTVFQIPHIKDMSKKEIHDCWMTSEDLKAIRQACIGTVREMNKGVEPPEGTFLRGLDQHSDKYRERKDEINNQIYDAVFRIQEFQRLSGKDASEVMAKMCTKYSEPSVIAAHMSAISDIFSAHKDTWTQRAIPDANVFEEHPEGQGTFNY